MRLGLLLLLVAASPLAAQMATLEPLPHAPLTLRDAIRLGRTRALAARIAQSSLGITEARIRQRRADRLPSASGALSATRQTVNLDEFGIPVATGVSDPFNLFRARLTGSQALFDAGVVTRLRAARDTAIAAGLDARAISDLAGATAGIAWLRVRAAEETLRARQADSVGIAAFVTQARALVEAGVSPRIDVTRNETALAALVAQIEIARNQIARAQLDLARALDLDGSTTLQLAETLDADLVDLPGDAMAAEQYALLHRAELAAERARLTAAETSLSAIRREWLPTASVNGYVQQSGRTLAGAAGTWLAQLAVNIPILDGFRRQARRDEQQIRVALARLREQDVARQIALEARQAMVDLISSRTQLGLADERLRLAEQEFAETDERFRAGVAGSLETTAAQNSLLAARDARIQARLAVGASHVAVWRALGLIETLP